MITDEDLVGLFQRHSVPIFVTLQKGKKSDSKVITAFVLSVADQWFLVTAGHCLRDIIDEPIKKHGCQLTQCYLIDYLGSGAIHEQRIPFAYHQSNPSYLSDGVNFDYGVMVLSPYYRALLEKNNVQALDERVWKMQPSKVDYYFLLGVPAELIKKNLESVEIIPTLHKVLPLYQRPEAFPDSEVPLFYGRVALGAGVTDIKGMSGGPIFGFYANEQGELRYW